MKRKHVYGLFMEFLRDEIFTTYDHSNIRVHIGNLYVYPYVPMILLYNFSRSRKFPGSKLCFQKKLYKKETLAQPRVTVCG